MEEAIDTGFGKAALPTPNHRPADAGKPGDLSDIQSVSRVYYDPSPGDMFLHSITIGDPGFLEFREQVSRPWPASANGTKPAGR